MSGRKLAKVSGVNKSVIVSGHSPVAQNDNHSKPKPPVTAVRPQNSDDREKAKQFGRVTAGRSKPKTAATGPVRDELAFVDQANGPYRARLASTLNEKKYRVGGSGEKPFRKTPDSSLKRWSKEAADILGGTAPVKTRVKSTKKLR